MARPCKKRRICAIPRTQGLIPKKSLAENTLVITMTLDEYEAIRLIDLKSFTQEECAASMGVARTTVQAVYDSARYKLAQCLCNGWELKVAGGNYFLCEGRRAGCSCSPCQKEEGKNMQVAVTYEAGQVFQHFGRTEQFKIYQISDGEITGSRIIGTDGNGHGALAGYLKELDVSVLICGGLGGGAKTALKQAGIEVYAGASGDADQAVTDFLSGKLEQNEDIQCSHHQHEHGDDGGHNCHSGGCHQ